MALAINITITDSFNEQDGQILIALGQALSGAPAAAPKAAAPAPKAAAPKAAAPVPAKPAPKEEPVEEPLPEEPVEEPTPAPEPVVEESEATDEALREEAIRRATELVSNGKAAQVKAALAAVKPGAKVGQLEGDDIRTFLEALDA